MANATKFNVGVIGGGEAVRMAAPALRELGKVGITYLETAFAEQFTDFDLVANPAELFDRDMAASLYIATPVHTHASFLRRAAALGIPTLIEKPLLLNLEERDLIGPAMTANIFAAFRKRFSQMADSILCARLVSPSQPSRIDYTWLAPHPGPHHWKLRKETAGGGVTMDVGCHILDLFEYLVGRITDLQVEQCELDQTFRTDCKAQISCAFANGSEGRILIGWAMAESVQKVNFVHADQHVVWLKSGGDRESRLLVTSGRHFVSQECDRTVEYRKMFAELEKARLGKPNTLPTFEDGMRNMELIASVHRQMNLA